MEFEWDPEKNSANIRKHGFDFNEAVGIMNGRMITVVYTWRGNSRRIISARRARPNEQTAYRQGYRSE